MSESRGMERYETKKKMGKKYKKKSYASGGVGMRFSDEYARGEDPGRYQERMMGMIKEDHSKIANLPQDVHYYEYPKTGYQSYYLNDEISGIDKNMDHDISMSKRHRAKSMY